MRKTAFALYRILGAFATFASIWFGPAFAAPQISIPTGVTMVQTVEGITEYRLSNGLKVLLAEDSADERVTVNLTYLVGARHEGTGEAGMAHLLEHLIFKGTPTNPDPKAEFRKRGFTYNGTTSADRTNYFATFVSSPESLDWYLSWQADAMVNSHIAKKDLDSEMSVVRNEFEMQESNPIATLSQRVNAASYLWHPYRRPPIGTKSDIESVSIEQLRKFYRAYYRPDNAFLVVAGKFDSAQTLAAIQRSLGRVPQPTTPLMPATTIAEPVQDGEREVTVRRPSAVQVVLASYRVPPALHPDREPLEVLGQILGDSISGRLHKALVEPKLAQATFASPSLMREGGRMLFGALISPEDDAARVKQIMLGVVESMRDTPVTEAEFSRAKAKLDKARELAFANAAAVAAGATAMEVLGDWRAVFVSRDRLKAVTLSDVNRVATTYLLQANRTTGHLIPTAEPLRAPSIGAANVAAFMDGYKLDSRPPETHEFDFGMESLKQKIQLSESPTGIKTATLAKPVRGDLVTMTINLKFGNLSSLLNQDSAAAMASAMLLRGTTRYTRQQIDDEFVRLGASPSFSLGTTGGRVSLVAKKETFMQAVDLVLHVLKDPGFPEHEFEELRSASLKSLDGRIKDKSAQASSAWERYGNPYSKDDFRYEQTLEETRRERAAVTVAQVRDFHARFYGGQHAQVALLGPIDNLAEFRTVVERELANWRAKVEWKRVPYPLTKSPPARLTFDTPDKANVSVRGYQEIALSSLGEEKAFFALDLAVKMFGGGSGSRLWNRLRETDGMSYSVGANLSASSYERNGKVNFYAEMAPQNLAKAEAAIMQEITDSLREGFTQAELDKYKQQFLFERKRGRSGDSYALNIMRSKMEFGLPWERSAENDRLISSLTLDEVNEAWRQYLQPADIVWGVFGDQSKVQ